MKEEYETDAHCPWCERTTKQVFRSDGHERDSSHDTRTCTVCGAHSSGMTGFDKYLLPGRGFKKRS